jgi:peptidoglycan/LPS O-acetylase OafA/YrhL
MLFHYVAASSFGAESFLTRKIASLAAFGWSGVDLFFVLSGFLITGILLRAKSAPGYFTNFYMRRLLRIFPLYYGALVVLFVVVPAFHPVRTEAVQRIYDTQGWLWAYSQDIAISFYNSDFYDVDWLWVGHFWSLAVEEHFYLVWPLLVFVCNRRALVWTSIALMIGTPLVRFAMLAHHMDPAAVYTLTLCRTDELALGGLVAVMSRETGYLRLARMARWGCLVAALYLGFAVAIRRKPLWWSDPLALGLGFSALALGPWVMRPCSSWRFRLTGARFPACSSHRSCGPSANTVTARTSSIRRCSRSICVSFLPSVSPPWRAALATPGRSSRASSGSLLLVSPSRWLWPSRASIFTKRRF